VPAAIEFQTRLGFETIRAHNEGLVQCVRERFRSIRDVSLATPAHPELHGFMTAFRLPPRVQAPAFYNTEEEIDRLGAAVEKLLEE
jgi:selenocysteine lyase/cysteine desulfurase